jgi:hypothetical protein
MGDAKLHVHLIGNRCSTLLEDWVMGGEDDCSTMQLL